MKLTPILTLVLLFFGLASCSKSAGRKPTFPVSGRVLLPDGKPAEHALVVFHPVDESGEGIGKPHGKVGADGGFKLTTYDADDGAPAGEYRVTVELWLAGKGDDPPANRLNVKFSKPETSGLTATVGSGPTDLKLFELKR